MLQLIKCLWSFCEQARLIFRKECSKLYYSFHDLNITVARKWNTWDSMFQIIFFLFSFDKMGKRTWKNFSLCSKENKRIVKTIIEYQQVCSQALKSEANIAQKVSKTLVKKSKLINERIRGSTKSMCLDESILFFKSCSI